MSMKLIDFQYHRQKRDLEHQIKAAEQAYESMLYFYNKFGRMHSTHDQQLLVERIWDLKFDLEDLIQEHRSKYERS